MLSPYAEVIARIKLTERGINGIQAASAGLVVLFPEPVNQKVNAVANAREIYMTSHKATALKATDFSETTLIICMDDDSKSRIYNNFKDAVNVYTLKEYVGSSGDIRLPIGGSVEEYEQVCKELEALLESLIEKEIDS